MTPKPIPSRVRRTIDRKRGPIITVPSTPVLPRRPIIAEEWSVASQLQQIPDGFPPLIPSLRSLSFDMTLWRIFSARSMHFICIIASNSYQSCTNLAFRLTVFCYLPVIFLLSIFSRVWHRNEVRSFVGDGGVVLPSKPRSRVFDILCYGGAGTAK